MKKNFITTIEITDSHIKLFQALNQRQGNILRVCEVNEIAQFSDEQIVETLLKMLSPLKMRLGQVVAIIPRRLTILKQLELPSTDNDEIKKMINLQIPHQVPYSKEDIVLDHMVLEKKDSGHAKVLVVVAHRQEVTRYLQVFYKAGIHPHQLTLSSIGVTHWYVYQGEKITSAKDSPVVIINIDRLNTEICFIHRQQLLFSRNIAFGTKDLIAENIFTFMKQIGLTIRTYEKEAMGPAIAEIIIASSISTAFLLKEALKQHYSVNINIVDPISNISSPKGVNLSSIVGGEGLSMTVGLGLILSRLEKPINLIPLEIRDIKKIKQQKREGIKTTILFLIAFFLCILAFFMKTYKDGLYLRRIQSDINSHKPEVKEVKEKMRRLRFLRGKLKDRVIVINIIEELYHLLPEEIFLSLLHLNDKGVLLLQGISTQGNRINSFQEELLNSSLFSEVTLQYATKQRTSRGEKTRFQITCQISQQGEGRSD